MKKIDLITYIIHEIGQNQAIISMCLKLLEEDIDKKTFLGIIEDIRDSNYQMKLLKMELEKILKKEIEK